MSPEDKQGLSALVYALVEGGADDFVALKEPELPNLSNEEVVLVPNDQKNEAEPQLPAKPAPIAAKVYEFVGNVVFFGFGGVAECTLPVLVRHLNLDLKRVTVIDMLDKREVMKNWIDQGVTFVQEQIIEKNLKQVLERFLKKGDLLIDVCYDVSCVEVLRWCRAHEVFYVNTSVEGWNYIDGFDKRSPYDKSLYARHQEIDEEVTGWKDNNGTTAILDMGANPGLISHFAKQGVLDLAKAKKVDTKPINKNDYATVAKNLGVKVILDTERDTQISIRPKQVDEFVGTWSVLGLVEEASSPVELGWGTHETELPPNAAVPDKGPKNQIFISQMGMNTLVRGFVPKDPKMPPVEGIKPVKGCEIVGTLIRHGEAYTISKFFTTADGKYRPTVYYCYLPCDATVASLREFASNNYCHEFERKPQMQRILYDNDILSGSDTLGVMIGGYDDNHVWWCGTSLNIEDARILCPLQNSTTIQVAIGLVAGICWLFDNPRRGVVRPEDLDTDFVLNIAKPYLGTFISEEFEWSPSKNFINTYTERKDCEIDEKNLWSFRNFQFKPT
jgi:homospermidine synthase